MKTNTGLRLFALIALLVLVGNIQAQSVSVPTITVAKGSTGNLALSLDAGGGATNFDFTMTYDPSIVNEAAISLVCDPAIVGLTSLTCTVDKADNQIKGIGVNSSSTTLVSGAFALINLPVLASAPTGDSVNLINENFATEATVIPVDATWTLTVDIEALNVDDELYNISTRADVGTGNNIAIAGFIISGSGQKCVVIRGRGPSVNVDGAASLPDPTITLKSGLTTIAENDNWTQQDNPADVAIIESLGLAPGDLLDAAIYTCLDPGAYTVLTKGYLGTTGVGMVEVLDVDDASPYLGNISTRARVGTGHLVTIAGFIITGNTPKQILIRGRGPSVGIIGETRLADPTLALKSGSTTIASNDNWQDAANAADISATGKAPGDPLDSAIMMILEPGAYTAILRGVDNVEGTGIVEVFDLTGR